MHITTNPTADAERFNDAEQARDDHFETLANGVRNQLRDAVLDALLSGNTAAIVPSVTIDGKTTHMHLTECMSNYRYELDAQLLRLIAAALKQDHITAHDAAQQVSIKLQDLHADDVVERLELAGEVLA
jgi:hypothetical protein